MCVCVYIHKNICVREGVCVFVLMSASLRVNKCVRVRNRACMSI